MDEPARARLERLDHPKPQLTIWRRLPITIASLALILCGGYVLTLNTSPKITALSSASNGSPVTLLRSSQTYQTAAQQILAGSLLNRTKITIDTSRFNRQMKARFPELAEASVTLPLIGHRPLVELAAVAPQLILTNQQGAYLVDAGGKAIVQTNETTGISSLHLPAVTDESNVPIKVGKGALTAGNVTFITTIVQELQAKQISIDSISLPKLPDELHVRIKSTPYYIKFDMNGDPRLQAGTFLAVKQKLEADHVTPAQYIDVRVEERAYYK